MSAFGAKADVEWCCEESPLMTQSGRARFSSGYCKARCQFSTLRGYFMQRDLRWGSPDPTVAKMIAASVNAKARSRRRVAGRHRTDNRQILAGVLLARAPSVRDETS